MPYVNIPKDLNQVKSKFIFNLTRRQVFCFALGAAAGLPVFFLTRKHIGVSMASMLMILCMLPFFMFAMYEKNGQPLETVLRHMIQSGFVSEKNRPYKTENFYGIIDLNLNRRKEVKRIVQKARERENAKVHAQADPRGKEADSGNPAGKEKAAREGTDGTADHSI